MAVDTRDKRMSMIGFARAFVRLFQNPTSTVGAVAREMLEFLYSGIALAAPVAALPRSIALVSSRSNAVSLVSSRSNAVALTSSR